MAALPPGIPLTLQETVVSVAPVTVAEKFCVAPSRGAATSGVMVTVTVGGGGGGGATATRPAVPPAAQPAIDADTARSARIGRDGKKRRISRRDLLRFFCERGRMPSEMQAKGQRDARLRVFPFRGRLRCKLLDSGVLGRSGGGEMLEREGIVRPLLVPKPNRLFHLGTARRGEVRPRVANL